MELKKIDLTLTRDIRRSELIPLYCASCFFIIVCVLKNSLQISGLANMLKIGTEKAISALDSILMREKMPLGRSPLTVILMVFYPKDVNQHLTFEFQSSSDYYLSIYLYYSE